MGEKLLVVSVMKSFKVPIQIGIELRGFFGVSFPTF